MLEDVSGDVDELGGFVAGDGLHVGAEGENQSDNKESIGGQRSSDVRDDGQRFVTPVKQVQGTKQDQGSERGFLSDYQWMKD